MNRKQFIQSAGASCKNWNWSWSFVNHEEMFVIFGAWDRHMNSENALILSEDWERNESGRRQSGYEQAVDHLDLVTKGNYRLKIFCMKYSDANKDELGHGPAKMAGFEPVLHDRSVQKIGVNWYAYAHEFAPRIAEQVDDPEQFLEGASASVTINAYERNGKARRRCLEHHGFRCSACGISFEERYGELGKEFIHVHHIVPLSKLRAEYQIDPINDLIPVCPNCHAMIHRYEPALKVEDIRSRLEDHKCST